MCARDWHTAVKGMTSGVWRMKYSSFTCHYSTVSAQTFAAPNEWLLSRLQICDCKHVLWSDNCILQMQFCSDKYILARTNPLTIDPLEKNTARTCYNLQLKQWASFVEWLWCQLVTRSWIVRWNRVWTSLVQACALKTNASFFFLSV